MLDSKYMRSFDCDAVREARGILAQDDTVIASSKRDDKRIRKAGPKPSLDVFQTVDG